MIPLIKEYPVFEADQVLSQTHLNKLIAYLEEQDRLSRISLLGMGVVCGLEINRPTTTSVRINCGTAITSLGYLIPFDTGRYTHFKETTLSEEFLNPDLVKHEYLQGVYDYSQIYQPFENVLELLYSDATDDGKVILTEQILDDKVIMLLIEAPLIDEKNCVTIDCADKGKRLQFKIRPLLIDREDIEDSDIKLNNYLLRTGETLILPKFNVPNTTIETGQSVLNAFNGQIVKVKSKIGEGIKSIHDHYQTHFNELTNYNALANAFNRINSIHNGHKDGIYVQYVMDWINDLVATYNDIGHFNRCNPTVCCPNLELFPFHVLLGLAEFETSVINDKIELTRFRTPMVKTGVLHHQEKEKQDELRMLLERLIHILNNFDLNLDVVLKESVKITPSMLGKAPLAERAMPFYYDNIKDLNLKWSYNLMKAHKIADILCYHSKDYNTTDDHVIEPLKYDYQASNFYRIEGHIGERYDRAIANILSQRSKYRLPFSVVALNASDYSKKTVDISKHIGDWADMELDYDMAKRKVLKISQSVINWITFKKADLIKETLMTEPIINSLKDILTEVTDLLAENLQEYLVVHEDFKKVFNYLNFIFMLHRTCLWIGNQNNTFSDLAEDLIDHFDEINSLFLEDPFTVLYEEAYRRWEIVYKEIFFSKFLETHPGIDHKAGVPEGGTFIMLYIDSSVFAVPKISGLKSKSEGLITKMANYKKMFKFSPEKEEEIYNSLPVAKESKINTKLVPQIIDDGCKDNVEKVKGYVIDSLKTDLESNMPHSVKDYLLNNLGKYFDRNVFEDITDNKLPEKVVIADFYLPYICCSKGVGIQILVPPAGHDDTLLADFYHEDFNKDDFFTNI